jgi:hypothetical protein
VEIVKRNELHRFVVLSKTLDRRAHARLDQSKPSLARDFERYARTVAAFIRLAMIRLMLRRLTRSSRCS